MIKNKCIEYCGVSIDMYQLIYTFIILIASIDMDQVQNNLDFNILQSNINNITFCNIENEMVI